MGARLSAALFLRLGVAVAGGRIRLLVPDAGFSAVAQLDGYVPIPPPFYIVPAKMSAGFTGLFPVHCNYLLALLYIILCNLQPLVFYSHHIYTILHYIVQ